MQKDRLIGICLGLTNLVNKNISQDFLATEPKDIKINYSLGEYDVAFKVSRKNKEAEND